MTDIELQLVALADELDHPDGEELVARVRTTLAIPELPPIAWHVPKRRARWVRLTSAAAIAATMALIVAIAVPDSRSALAELFNIGGVEARDSRRVDGAAPSTTSSTSSSSSPARPDVETVESIAAADRAVDFPLRLPPGVTPVALTVDHRVPGGAVAADFGAYRLVQLAAPDSGAVMTKVLDPRTRLTATTVRGVPAAWFTGSHHRIAYLDRNGDIRYDTMREVGHVLLWSEAGVTFRIEGPETLAEARRIAESIR